MEMPNTPEFATARLLGILPLHKFDADPSTDAAGSWPSGMFGYYVSGATLRLVGYDRETGWVEVTLA